MTTTSDDRREALLEQAIERVYEEVKAQASNDEPKSLTQEEEVTVRVYDKAELKLVQKIMAMLDDIAPKWQADPNYAHIVEFIKEECTKQMTRQMTTDELDSVIKAMNLYEKRMAYVEHIETTIKTLQQVDPNWRSTMPNMVKKMVFDLGHGRGLCMFLY